MFINQTPVYMSYKLILIHSKNYEIPSTENAEMIQE